MATIREAKAINRVLMYFLFPGTCDEDQAREAAEFLAERARNALLTGFTTEYLRQAWQRREAAAGETPKP